MLIESLRSGAWVTPLPVSSFCPMTTAPSAPRTMGQIADNLP